MCVGIYGVGMYGICDVALRGAYVWSCLHSLSPHPENTLHIFLLVVRDALVRVLLCGAGGACVDVCMGACVSVGV